MAHENGPYIIVACFCDMVLEDKTGALSLIRIIDTLSHQEAGPNPPKDLPPFTHPMFLVLALKSGMALGRYEVRIVPQRPDGIKGNPISFTFHFEGDERGQNLIGQINLQFTQEGLHWFKIYLCDDDQEDLLTAIPLRLKYNRVITGPTSTG